MSRHRFVKNLDLDGRLSVYLLSLKADAIAEMEEEDEEEDEGMTAEQKGMSSLD
jgi:hypothetical protein